MDVANGSLGITGGAGKEPTVMSHMAGSLGTSAMAVYATRRYFPGSVAEKIALLVLSMIIRSASAGDDKNQRTVFASVLATI
jgi:hypothetical protein